MTHTIDTITDSILQTDLKGINIVNHFKTFYKLAQLFGNNSVVFRHEPSLFQHIVPWTPRL